LKYPIWYVVAVDHLRDAPRIFRCDRMLHAMREGGAFPLLPKEHFAPSLDDNDLSL
jgi:predicted DNA-binding transcriptional regulator YafY